MLNFSKKTWAIGGVVVALLGTAAAYAMHDHSPEKRAEWATKRISNHLDLNADQKTAFSKVTDSYLQIRGTAPEFMLDLSGKLKELAADDTLTQEEVNQLREEIKAEFDRRTDLLVPEFVAFYNTLNEEQRELVVARLGKMSNKIEKRIERKTK